MDKKVAADYGKRVGEIAYIFCSDEKILEVNRQYLQHDYYTDIITFDYCAVTVFRAIYSSAWILSARMQSNSTNRMSGSFTASLYMVSCISVASMTKVRRTRNNGSSRKQGIGNAEYLNRFFH